MDSPFKPQVRTFLPVRYAALFSAFDRYTTAVASWWEGTTTPKDPPRNSDTEKSEAMAATEVLWLPQNILPAQLDIKPIITVVDMSAISESESENDLVRLNSRKTSSTPRRGSGPLVSASLITNDFDALRFDAAASLQVIQSQSLSTSTPKSHHLISSPYNDPDHLLDLRTLTTQSRLFSLALTYMQPIVEDYATADYMSSFNWNEVLVALRTLAHAEGHKWAKQAFYTVIFRSKLNPNVDEQRLHDLDKDSHREAVESGQLLKYWFGKRNVEEQNLATCIWHSKEDARLGGLGPDHKKARIAARDLYHEIKFTTWRMVIEEGAEAIRLEEWSDR